jgi:hypothetical protein
VEADALWALANRVNLKAQATFEKAHPIWDAHYSKHIYQSD